MSIVFYYIFFNDLAALVNTKRNAILEVIINLILYYHLIWLRNNAIQKLQSSSTALMSLILDLTNLWYSKLYDLSILVYIVLEIKGIFKYVLFNITILQE